MRVSDHSLSDAEAEAADISALCTMLDFVAERRALRAAAATEPRLMALDGTWYRQDAPGGHWTPVATAEAERLCGVA